MRGEVAWVRAAPMLTFVLLGASGCLDGDGLLGPIQEPVPAPRLEPGNWWRYASEQTTHISAYGSTITDAYGPMTMRVAAPAELGNTTAWFMAIEGDLDGTVPLGGTSGLADGDLALVRWDLAAAPIPMRRDCALMPDGCVLQLDTRFATLQMDSHAFLGFPLTRGATWESGPLMLSLHDGSVFAQVLGSTRIDTPAGTLDVVRTRFTSSLRQQFEGYAIESSTRLDVDYAPAAEGIARWHARTETRSGGGTLTIDMETVLLDYGLEQRPAWTLDQMAAWLETGDAPPANLTPTAPLVAALEAPSGPFNAAQARAATWTARPDGGVPPYEVEWALAGPRGIVHATGDRLAVVLDTPGVYRVDAVVRDAHGDEAPLAGLLAVAYEADAAAECPDAIPSQPAGCDAVKVPFGMGAYRVEVQATLKPGIPLFPGGLVGTAELELLDADGQRVASTPYDGNDAAFATQAVVGSVEEWVLATATTRGDASVGYHISVTPA